MTHLLVLLALAQPPAPSPAAAPGLRCGFASRKITPEIGARPVYLAGFANDRRATGVHDDLWARAVAVSDGRQTVAIVAVDLIGIFHATVLKAREELQQRVPGAVLVVASTHNHQGPDTMGLWGKGRFSSGVDVAYLERVRKAIVETAADALGRLKPARLVLGRTRTPGLVEDGRLPTVIDDTLVAMLAIGEDGATLGTVVAWSSHPEALGSGNTLVTSDFPHFLRKRMEAGLGGTCVFLVGSIGGLMTPLGLKLTADDGHPIPADSFALAQAVGERAADAALEALAQGKASASTALEHRSATVYVPLENRLFRLATVLGVLDRELFSDGRPATSLFGDDLRTEVGYLRIGDAEALLVPAEIYPELVLGGIPDPQDPGADFPGAPRERPLFALLSSEYRLVVGLANDEIGYVIPRSQWDASKPFAYGRAEDQYGEVNSVGPQAAARLLEAFERLLGR
ncbi:MAG TPA: hypothetical protein VGB87_06500 [Vicinamibacteria bacterium]